MLEYITLKQAHVEQPSVPVVNRTEDYEDLSSLDYCMTGNLSVVNPKSIVFELPWSEFVTRPDANERYRTLAETMGSRLLAVNNPGVGPGSSRLGADEMAVIRKGNFDGVSEKKWQVLNSRLEGDVTVMGYSLGAVTAANLLKNTPDGTDIKRLVLWESVGIEPVPGIKLLKDFGAESTPRKSYLAQNPPWMREKFPSDLEAGMMMMQRPRANLAYGLGISKAPLFDDLEGAREREVLTPDTEIVVMHGSDGRMSTERANTALVERLRDELGMKSVRHIVLLGESHSMIDSLPTVVAATRLLK